MQAAAKLNNARERQMAECLPYCNVNPIESKFLSLIKCIRYILIFVISIKNIDWLKTSV
jgi:hypothetical protein